MALTAILDMLLALVSRHSDETQADFDDSTYDLHSVSVDEIKFVPIVGVTNDAVPETVTESKPQRTSPLTIIKAPKSPVTGCESRAVSAPAHSAVRGPRVECSGMRPPRIPKCAVSPTVVCKGVCEEYGDECVECDLRRAANVPSSPCSVVCTASALQRDLESCREHEQ
mmetsp:Transcript_22901/g.56917  ORF Transcript_22901/g.56917 Transcript_22901/m.56917 type:complete len:169 (+) Transcript_22901:1440-1946(+)